MLAHFMPWDFIFILLVLGVVVPWRGTARVKKLLDRPRLGTTDRLALYASTIAFQCTAAAVVAWRSLARGLTPRQLGLTLTDLPLAAGVTAALSILLVAQQIVGLRRMARKSAEHPSHLLRIALKLFPQTAVERLAFIALAATVALCEEFLYRGFVFAAIRQAAGGSLAAAAIGSALLFSVAHLYQGRRGVISTFVVGLIFAGTRIFTQSLAPPIVVHLLVDLVAGLAAPRLLRNLHVYDVDSSSPAAG